MMTSDFIVATNLKTLVGLYGLTYKRLSKELNMDYTVVFRLVKGQRKVSFKLLDKIISVEALEGRTLEYLGTKRTSSNVKASLMVSI